MGIDHRSVRGLYRRNRRGTPAAHRRRRCDHCGGVAQLRQSRPLLSGGGARVGAARSVGGLRFLGRQEASATTASLDEWFARFFTRYPPPAHEARGTQPGPIGGVALWISRGQPSSTSKSALRSRPSFYLDYVMTETNVAAAVRRGVSQSEIRAWCAETLAPIWNGIEREVLFRGYFACMSAEKPYCT